MMIEMAKINKENSTGVYSDTMDDHTNHLFRGWPERLYVLYDQRILYRGGEGPSEYSILSLEYCLKKNIFYNERGRIRSQICPSTL
jgi:hypothetical protein